MTLFEALNQVTKFDNTAVYAYDKSERAGRQAVCLFSTFVSAQSILVDDYLLGPHQLHSSDSVARSLGIAVETVRIHRRNVTGKLQISSQQELFAIFLKRITEEHG